MGRCVLLLTGVCSILVGCLLLAADRAWAILSAQTGLQAAVASSGLESLDLALCLLLLAGGRGWSRLHFASTRLDGVAPMHSGLGAIALLPFSPAVLGKLAFWGSLSLTGSLVSIPLLDEWLSTETWMAIAIALAGGAYLLGYRRSRAAWLEPAMDQHQQASAKPEGSFCSQLLAQMAEGVGVCHAIADFPSLQFTVWSPQLVELTGYTLEVINQQGFCQLLLPDPTAQQQAIAAIERLWQGESWQGNEWEITRSDGQSCSVSVSASRLENQAPEPQILLLLRDITPRRLAEKSLSKYEHKTRALIAALPDLILRMTGEGVYLDFFPTDAFKVLGGYGLIGQTIYEGNLPKVVADLRMYYIQQALTTGEIQIYEQQLFVDGKLRSEEVRVVVCGDNEVLVIVRDMSDRQQAEATLRTNEQFLRNIYDNAHNCIFVVDVLENGEFCFVGLNPMHQHFIGLSIEKFQGKTPAEVFPSAIAIQISQHYRQCVEAKTTLVYEELIPFHGKDFWWLTSLAPIQDENGRIHRLVGTSTDITNLKLAERQLQHQANRERMLNRVVQTIRRSLDLSTIFDIAVTEVASFLEIEHVAIYHYRPQQKSWLCMADFAQTQTYPHALAAEIPDENNPIAAQIKQGKIVCVNDTQNLQDDVNLAIAAVYPGSWLIVPLQTNESVWGCLTMVRYQTPSQWDESEIELASAIAAQLAIAIQQSQLYQQLQRLNHTLDQQVQQRTLQLRQLLDFEATLKRITDAVRDSLDENQILQTVLQELANTLEIHWCDTGLYDLKTFTSTICCQVKPSSPELAGLEPRQFTLSMTEYAEEYQQLLAGHYFQVCKQHAAKDWFTALACPIVDDREVLGDLWLFKSPADTFDLQELRLVQQVANQCAIALRQSRLYQAAQAQVTELERLHRLKDDFLSTVSHELRTPMSNIKMATQMLEITLENLNIGPDKRNLSRYFQILKDEGQRELDLINDLLDLTRLDAETDQLLLSRIRLQDWLPHFTDAFTRAIAQQQQHIRLDISPLLPPVTTDLNYLERILTELLNNACKYTPAGETIYITAEFQEQLAVITSPRLKPSWQPSLTECVQATVQITVTNTGIEIPASEGDRIFERFYRIPSNDPWKHSGTGLGLALVKKLVQQLSGSITLSSHHNQTTFILQLPQASVIAPVS